MVYLYIQSLIIIRMKKQENKCLSDITFSYKHPTGKIIGKLEYDEDVLILRYNGGVIIYPEIDKLIITQLDTLKNN